ncbi:MAG TPA: hypothetical protein VFG59_06960 [Anaeromyxobacter sp.]|nr:hypothetical protein [Anaeromyxobacter sp.]
MSCPHLKEVRMVFCRAYPVKKLVPLDQLVSAGSCETEGAFVGCAAFREARQRVEEAADESALVQGLTFDAPADPGKGRTP